MTIQEAIDKAIEGGYPKERIADLAVHVQAQYFLETTFWEALVRALGVEGDFEYIHLERGEPGRCGNRCGSITGTALIATSSPAKARNRSLRRLPTLQRRKDGARYESPRFSYHRIR